MDQIIFYISLFAALAILILTSTSLLTKRFTFFPPPRKNTWQYLVFWFLFRVMFFGLVILSIITFDASSYTVIWPRYFLWLPLCLIGFGYATYISFKLGWNNTHGEKKGLITSGFYQKSRNPVYVTSIIGMLGWGGFVNSSLVNILLLLWLLMYILAPFIEEPWLEAEYGDHYRLYKNDVPRFISLQSKFTKNITPFVTAELFKAKHERDLGNADKEFRHLENAHVLGQESTLCHVKVHILMLVWAIRNSRFKELLGQFFRILGAITMTPIGLVPTGNTGGANVSPFKVMPIIKNHQKIIDSAKVTNKII